MFEFSMLGPLCLRVGGRPVHIQGSFQKILLSVLVLSEDTFFPTDGLIEELWGSGHPRQPKNALQAHVSRLRRTLEQAEPARPAARLLAHPSGYQLVLNDDDQVDGWTFLHTVNEIEKLATRCPHRAAELTGRLRDALSMWRGPVFGGMIGGQFCQKVEHEYQDARLRAFELLFDAQLRRGNHSAIIAELSALVEGNFSPYQQRFGEQLMISLYRCGRQTDALRTYRKLVHRLSTQGIRPAPWLRACERAILKQDDVLDEGVTLRV
jgi:DNA-binding SARP family transcriptional activator